MRSMTRNTKHVQFGDRLHFKIATSLFALTKYQDLPIPCMLYVQAYRTRIRSLLQIPAKIRTFSKINIFNGNRSLLLVEIKTSCLP